MRIFSFASMLEGRPVTEPAPPTRTPRLGCSTRPARPAKRRAQHARWDVDQVREQLRVMADEFREAKD
jgi:hypothetical protein